MTHQKFPKPVKTIVAKNFDNSARGLETGIPDFSRNLFASRPDLWDVNSFQDFTLGGPTYITDIQAEGFEG
jgi:hypothetical protein